MPRYGKKQSIKDFEDKLEYIYAKNVDLVGEEDDDYGERFRYLLGAVEECIGSGKLFKDMYSKDFYNYENIIAKRDLDTVSTDNREYFYNNLSLMGDHIVNGVPFRGVMAGADYGLPWFFIVYEDNKGALRQYIPKKGNSMNPLSKMPFGEDQVADEKFAVSKGFKNYNEMDDANYRLLDETLLLQDITNRIQ